ncbi:MAG: class I adenylate-forming enzyme family protein [Steroidobacteraceae bacterium]
MSSLAGRLLGHAARASGSVALIDGGRRMSYEELATRASALAAGLRGFGVRAGDRVVGVLAHGADAVVAMYGSWFAGAVYVPVNVQARGPEIANVVRHSGARVLLHEPMRPELPVAEAGATGAHVQASTVPDLCDDASVITRTPDAGAGAGAVAMLLYTSGTTGRPKAVTLTAGNLDANVASIIQYLGLSNTDKVLSVLPLHYSYGNSVLHTHLAAGGTVVFERNLVFPHAMVETMAKEGVTGFSGVPSTFALLLSRVNLAASGLEALRYVTQAGAAMSPAMVARLRRALPGVKVFVMYGQTEATARLAYVPPDRLDEKVGSAGIAIPGVELQIRDEAGAALGPDVVGEVWARGANVMHGYWNDEEATRAVLRDGWLRTGDLGRMDRDGFLFLSGRRSDMIKTGANRVHPQEIEEVLEGLPGLREAAVAGIDDELLGQAVAAYVVPEPDSGLTIERIKAHCLEQLAPYKVPKHVFFLKALPRTASGKLQRFELEAATREESK